MPIIHTEELMDRGRRCAARAAAAMAEEALRLTLSRMESGYGRPIRRTGALMADVRTEVTGAEAAVGCTLPYAPLVHGGTDRMPARPFLAEALSGGAAQLLAAAERAMAEETT